MAVKAKSTITLKYIYKSQYDTNMLYNANTLKPGDAR